MRIEERYAGITEWFQSQMPHVETELHYQNAYQLIVAVILSAQCTDKRVNLVTPPFFDRFPTPQALAAAEIPEIFEYIRSISYPNNKSKNLSGMARMLCSDFGGEVPQTIEQLQRLPGVGRKTANVMGAVLFHLNVMPVDTHVFRVSARIGLTVGAKNPLQSEQQLTRYFPAELLPTAHHWLILHGRYVCTARKPHCEACGLKPWCKWHQQKERAAAKTRASIP